MIKKKFKNILVVLGGSSGERAVSLESGKACIEALKKLKYKVSSFDPKRKNLNLINKLKVDAILTPYMEKMVKTALRKVISSI